MFRLWDPMGNELQYSRHLFAQARRKHQQRESMEETAPQVSEALQHYRHDGEEEFVHEAAVAASQIMSHPVVTLSPDTPLEEASESISQYRFRHFPVLSHEEKLVGMLSDKDLFMKMRSDRKLSSAGQEERRVRDIMGSPVISAHPETEIRLIAKIFTEEKIGAMPIIDDEKALVGLITRSDILRVVVNMKSFNLWT